MSLSTGSFTIVGPVLSNDVQEITMNGIMEKETAEKDENYAIPKCI